ncbi:MAG TPA: prolipoprotein diacylglyceryl transferase [Gammaproteobacteria bacterium]|jgi:phosphatidylglycerol:prolipoprotein diacylglycerol transferase|nr:prolipoprotein diacylglyceryl transferase [Gammaproteobacteria bacterium]
MLIYPSIDPVAFHIFGWPVYWYGLMYLVGFFAGWAVLSLRLRQQGANALFTAVQLSDLVFYAALGAIIGGRLGYILFYEWQILFSAPWQILKVWQGGMSFHGGLLGVLVALWCCARKMQKPLLALTDFIAPAVPIGLAAGRIGNFINGELWGRVTTMPWGMVFPYAGDYPRHPSQLYEFLLEGVLLFFILWFYSRKPRPIGAVSGLFALCYGVFRIAVECFREPDAHIGYLFGWLTQGQLLSLPLIAVGVILLVRANRL